MVALGWRLAGMAPLLLAGMASAKKKMGGSLKCEKGIFTSEAKDAAIALCDEHFPDEKAKNDWIVMFYEKQSAEDVHEGLNRIAQDLGNEPPEKSKSLIKTKKQRSRLKDLGEKYEFEVELPKKGPAGSDPLLKVGAVCCDCGTPPKLCEGRRGLFFVKAGKQEPLAAPVGQPGDVVKLALQKLGYVKAAKRDSEL
mmetsp:Transcript_51112/g.141569  ORF Transcript_51112/g.141569 Transcript_51112/m.141569 type:complete len:196 (-) Transcript_51112:133-720(-)|eukprot:CAMPEP_0179076680 /NCGR_PEP_ID=MMETSP0796-20121207/34225_1 /TAXON_ID=73915 /ORGANISM="Pyrodinium bahamense, Strain pbaha01" /LENGTH=195 /DNA_ID=CAMNT_0020773939 /DNA_START=201 /DNA_END=788 /DNA_ORIENTATION=+